MQEIINVADKFISLDMNDLDSIDFGFTFDFLNNELAYSYIFSPAGRNHYRLLRKISQSFKGITISDVGTNTGLSAVSLSGVGNTVKSFDVVDLVDPRLKEISNQIGCEFIFKNLLEDESLKKYVISSDIIFLDTDHDGEFEKQFYTFLVDSCFSGTLLIDDIQLNKPMNDFWNSIVENKKDLTHLGHFSGTGIVNFNTQS